MVEGLTIGRHSVPFPIIQGGMGVRVSGSRLAGNVALCGGIGLIAAAGLGLGSEHYNGKNFFAADRQALIDELRITGEIRKKQSVPNLPFAFSTSTLGLWHFDALSGQDAADLGSEANPALVRPRHDGSDRE